MAMPTYNAINGVKVAQFASALYGTVVGATTNNVVLSDIAKYGDAAVFNAYYTYSFGSQTDATVAATVVANLGITGASATEAKSVVAAALTGAAPGTKGAALSSLLTSFSGMTTNATYGAAATAWNASIANAVAYTNSGATADYATSAGAVYNLGTGVDNMTGGSGADTFNAHILNNSNTLQSGDVVDGGAGADTLNADMASSATFAVTPHLTSIEKVSIRAEATQADPTNGNNTSGQGGVQIDAQRSSSVTTWESSNSRSDVIVEDVRTNSNVTTIAFVESDPGNVDLAVYFNQRNLVNTSGGTSTLNILLMDTVAAAGTPTTPLLNHNFNTFAFYANDALVTLGGANTAAGTAIDTATTYAALLAAFQLALKTANVNGVVTDLSTTVTASLSAVQNMTTAAGTSAAAASFLNLNGQVLILTTPTSTVISTAHSVTGAVGGWTAAGPSPTTGAIAQTMNSGATSSAALVNTAIILDDVGMGSMGGDLVAGGMSVGTTSSSKGIERFNIEVRDNSQLQTISSTNNTLREVVIVNGATTSSSSAYVTTTKNAGNLTVNGTVAASDAAMAGSTSGAGAAGFTDVRLIDASAMTGSLALTAAINSTSIAKYVNLVDTAASATADVAAANTVGLGANFIYTGGANNDTMVVTIDGGVAASRSTVVSGQSDFTFLISGGAGNDAITVNVAASELAIGENWHNNQDLNDNIDISGGAGDDVIRTPGGGDTKIDAGDGADVVYTDNTGAQVQTITTRATTENGNAAWVFNTSDQVTAASMVRNVYDLRSDSIETYNLYKATLVVTYKGLPTATVTLANTTSYKTTDYEINQAIKSAINNDATLKNLLIAEDGPAGSLVVTSLIDGAQVAADLGVAIAVPVASTVFTTTEISGMATAYGSTAITTSALALAAMTTSLATYTTNGDYTSALAVNQAAVNITGADSTKASDNVVSPGTGNDIIVLGTTLGATVATSSNEVVTYAAGFGNDVIVNFDVAGMGMDYINFSAFVGSAPTVGAAYATTSNLIAILAETTANDTTAEVDALVKALDAATSVAANKQLYIAVNAHNVADVYSVANGTAVGDAAVTLQGSIDLADVAWAGLVAANFATTSATVNGASAAAGGGGGGGGGGILATTVTVAAAGTSSAVGTNATYNINVATTYAYGITGFAAGDKLAFAAGSALSVTNTSGTDGTIIVAGSLAGQSVTVTLTGVAVADDGGVFNAASFNTTFGAGSLA